MLGSLRLVVTGRIILQSQVAVDSPAGEPGLSRRATRIGVLEDDDLKGARLPGDRRDGRGGGRLDRPVADCRDVADEGPAGKRVDDNFDGSKVARAGQVRLRLIELDARALDRIR
jgi:hypothetical protein